MKRIISLLLTLLLLTGCTHSNSERMPEYRGECYATLVAYKTIGKHKHSSVYLQLNTIKTIHRVSIGRRKDPELKLGDSIKVTYAVYGNEVEIENVDIKTKYYNSRGFHSLPKYEYLN